MKIKGMGIVLMAIVSMGMFNSCEGNNSKIQIGRIFQISKDKPSDLIEDRIASNKTIKECKYVSERLTRYFNANNFEVDSIDNGINIGFSKERAGLVAFNYNYRESYKQDKWELGKEGDKWANIDFEIMFKIEGSASKINDYIIVDNILKTIYGEDYNNGEIDKLLYAYNNSENNNKNSSEVDLNLNNGWKSGKFRIDDGIVLIGGEYTPYEGISKVKKNYLQLSNLGLDKDKLTKAYKLDNLSVYNGATEPLGVTRIGKNKGVIIDNSNFKYIIDDKGVETVDIRFQGLKEGFSFEDNKGAYEAFKIYLDSNEESLKFFNEEIGKAVKEIKVGINHRVVNKNNYVLEYEIRVIDQDIGSVEIKLKLYKVII